MSFTAKNTNWGGTNADNGATGRACNAFVKVLNSGDFSSLLFKQTETTGASADAFGEMVLDYEITEAMVGHILQTGFMNTSNNYAPTGLLYDDVVVAEYTPTPAPTPEPTPAQEAESEAAHMALAAHKVASLARKHAAN